MGVTQGAKKIEVAQPGCTFLEWDSQFFERRIARLNSGHLDPAILERAFAFCRAEGIDCLYFLADSSDAETGRLALEHRFLPTDVRVSLHRPLSTFTTVASAEGIRLARPEDVDSLRAIARTAHRDGRFYFDQDFDRGKCSLFYETWIENSFHGFADAVLVAEADQHPVGYITCQLRDGLSQIGLTGVSDRYQGMGFGTKLVEQFLAWSAQKGAKDARVVTQGRNVPAQRLYQRNGFVTESMELWYHRWFKP